MGNNQSTGGTGGTQSTGGSSWSDGKGTIRSLEISSGSGKFFVQKKTKSKIALC